MDGEKIGKEEKKYLEKSNYFQNLNTQQLKQLDN